MKNWKLNSILIVLAFGIMVVGSLESCEDEIHQNAVAERNWVDVPAGYVGAEQCASCHQAEFDAWSGSHHQLAMLHASDSSVLGDFNNINYDQRGDRLNFYRQEEKFMIHLEKEDGRISDREVLFTFGYEPLQQYLVEDTAGKLQALTVAWNIEENEWMDITPQAESGDDWMHWTGNSMTWNAMCADCHSTAYRKNFDLETESYSSTWSEVNVACEACHGPGQGHISAVNAGQTGSLLSMTSSISSIELVDACAPCHSRRTAIDRYLDPQKAFLDQYDPALIDDRLYHADGQIDDEVYVYGSFRQSKMYHRGVKCTDCHDPHTADLRIEGNGMCSSCHAPADYDVKAHHFHDEKSEGAKCVNCHMPGKYYMVNDYRHDHSFRVPRPDLGAEYGTPDACTSCHADRSQQWAAEAIVDQFGPNRAFHFSDAMLAARSGDPAKIEALAALVGDTSIPSFARASIVAQLSEYNDPFAFNAIIKGLEDEEPLVRIASINALSFVPQNDRINTITPHLQDTLKAVRIAAARNMANIDGRNLRPDYAALLGEALVELRNALEGNLDMRDGLFAYGLYLERIQMPEKALVAYAHCLKLDELFNMARMNSSAIFNQLGRNNDAKVILEDMIRIEPENPQGHFALGLLLAEMNNIQASIGSMETAIELDSTISRYWYNLGLAYDRVDEKGKAEKAYYKTIELDGNHVPALKALTILYWRLDMKKDSYVIAQRLEELVPEDPEVIRILAQLREDLGVAP